MHHPRRQSQTPLRIRSLEYNFVAFSILLTGFVLTVHLQEGEEKNNKTYSRRFLKIIIPNKEKNKNKTAPKN